MVERIDNIQTGIDKIFTPQNLLETQNPDSGPLGPLPALGFEFEAVSESMSVADFKRKLGFLQAPDKRWHAQFNASLVTITLQNEPDIADKASGLYQGLFILQTHVEMVDAEIEDRDASTATHAARNADGAFTVYVIREYKKAHPQQEKVTRKDLDAFILTPQQMRESALYILANIAHDFGKGQVEAIDDNNGVIFYNQHMLTEKDNSKLTEEDFRRMKLHTDQGAYMLQSLFEILGIPTNSRFAKTLISITQHHHDEFIENYGTFVADATLIAAIIDQYDAMTSKRNFLAIRKFSPRDAKKDTKIQNLLKRFNNDEITAAYYAYLDLCIEEDEQNLNAEAGLQPAS